MADKPRGNVPTHRLRVLNKETDERGEVGAGWLNGDGSITIKLNMCVVLSQSQDVVLTLFPEDGRFPGKKHRGQPEAVINTETATNTETGTCASPS